MSEETLKIEELFNTPCVIEKYTDGETITYGVGFFWGDGTKTGLEIEDMKDIPTALAQLGAYVLKEKLGWKPEQIKAPSKKLIIPGRP